MLTRYINSTNFYYFDFLFDSKFKFDSFENVDIHETFGIYTTFNVDQGWIQVISDIKTTFSVQLFDIYPIPDAAIDSMRFMGSHIFTDFRRVDENLFHRTEDTLYLYETGFSLEGLKVRRLGNISEPECSCRVKMIWRKITL